MKTDEFAGLWQKNHTALFQTSLDWQNKSVMNNRNKAMRWLLISQNIILFSSGMVFPYYVIFIKESGANYVSFGFAYALFALSSAIAHYGAGKLTDKYGRGVFLALSSWGMAFSLVFFPSVTSI